MSCRNSLDIEKVELKLHKRPSRVFQSFHPKGYVTCKFLTQAEIHPELNPTLPMVFVVTNLS